MLDTNIQEISIGMTIINDQTYQWPWDKNEYVLEAINFSDLFTLWHKRIKHLEINFLQKYLLCLKVSYTDDICYNVVSQLILRI